jgi:hypothetical protein
MYEGEPVEIDIGIVDLMQALWDQGYKTYSCCEAFNKGVIQLWFSDQESYDRFRSLPIPTFPVGGGYSVRMSFSDKDAAIAALAP